MIQKRLVFNLLAAGLVSFSSAQAENLFSSFLVPGFATEYSAWDVLYSPYNGSNYPDFAAPYGGDAFGQPTTASAAGLAPPANSSPGNPLAYWDVRNPTITQTGTSTAFVIGPGSTGNIYSFSAPLAYQLSETTASPLGTVVFQFQTDGSLTDFSSIKLQYTNGSGQLVSLSANEMLREYRSSASSFGGLTNRTALQWDLTGLSITSYQIVWRSVSSSNSFQQATLDTADTYAPVIPASRSWNFTGAGSWSEGSKWKEGSSSNENGNVNFINTGAATVTLNNSHTVAQLTFDTPAAVTINPTGGSVLTANTGITTTAQAAGNYTIGANYQLGAYNLFDINAGTVNLTGVVSGPYGMEKNGNGTLNLTNNNTFTGSLSVNAGTLRLQGTNAYTGSTAVLFGTLIVAADAASNLPAAVPGALGNSTTNVIVGADSATFAVVGGASANLLIDGNHTIGRTITLANGTFDKTLGSQNTTTGAIFSGAVDFGTSTAVHLRAANVADRVTFRGGMSGGAAGGTVAMDGAGIVSLAGTGKTYAYANATNVNSGTLRIENGASLTGNGNVTVAAGATLIVHGSLNGSGALAINGGTLGGSGTINRSFTLDTGDVLSPGAAGNIGTLTTAPETWAGGGTLKLEINDVDAGIGSGWDSVNIAGALSLTATSGNTFKLQLQSLTTLGASGLVGDFNKNTSYSWTFLTTTSTIANFDASKFTLETSAFTNSLNGIFSVALTADSKGLAIQYSAVPEPSSAWLALSGVGLLLGRRRRRETPAR